MDIQELRRRMAGYSLAKIQAADERLNGSPPLSRSTLHQVRVQDAYNPTLDTVTRIQAALDLLDSESEQSTSSVHVPAAGHSSEPAGVAQ